MYKIYFDINKFANWHRKFSGRDWPKKVVQSLSDVAFEGMRVGQYHTKSAFKLKTDYVTRGIKFLPESASQRAAAERALLRYGDCMAKVYVRGSKDKRKSLDFMVHHETSFSRKPQHKFMAVPTKSLKEKSYRTSRGGVKRAWKPETLLKRFFEAGIPFNGVTTTKLGKTHQHSTGKRRGDAFLMRGRGDNTVYIVRRLSSDKWDLEFLYSLKNEAKIRKDWHFVENVRKYITAKGYAKIVTDISNLVR